MSISKIRTLLKATNSISLRSISTNCILKQSEVPPEEKADSFDGFLKHLENVKHVLKDFDNEPETGKKNLPENETFASLFRRSQLIRWGDFTQGLVVTGTIVHVMGDDLYIDFGHKFNCICRRPSTNGILFVRNAKVKLLINDLELSTRFLGSDTDMTLQEADGRILQLINSPISKKGSLDNKNEN